MPPTKVFAETKERALQAVNFGKMLRRDFEVAAQFSFPGTFDDVMQIMGVLRVMEMVLVLLKCVVSCTDGCQRRASFGYYE